MTPFTHGIFLRVILTPTREWLGEKWHFCHFLLFFVTIFRKILKFRGLGSFFLYKKQTIIIADQIGVKPHSSQNTLIPKKKSVNMASLVFVRSDFDLGSCLELGLEK